MANYYASARSNYFKVKDAGAFKEWVGSIPDLGVWEKDGMFAIYDNGGDSCGWPSWIVNDEGEDVEIDLAGELAQHPTEDSIAVLIEVGAEKLRYLCGYAVAVNHKGECEDLNLNRIYDLALERWGIAPTEATY